MQISRRLTRLKILATSYFESAERQSLETFHQGQTENNSIKWTVIVGGLCDQMLE